MAMFDISQYLPYNIFNNHGDKIMTPNEVREYYGNSYAFEIKTKMSHSSLLNWIKWGYIPEGSQHKIERLSNGDLKTEWSKK